MGFKFLFHEKQLNIPVRVALHLICFQPASETQ